MMNTCRHELLAAAHVIDDCAGMGVLEDEVIDEVGVPVDAVLAGQEIVEFPGEADLARDRRVE
jgi:Asp/Glu/hydantoin racemase